MSLEEEVSKAIDFLINHRVHTTDETLQRFVRRDIHEYFTGLDEEKKVAFEGVVIDEYLSRPLECASKEDYERVMFGLYIFDIIAQGRPKDVIKMDRTLMPNALQKIYEMMNSPDINLNDKRHKNIIEYAALVLTWNAPFDESYRAIEKNLDGPLFYDLLIDLAHINIKKAEKINTDVGKDGMLIDYPHVREAPFKDGIYTNASVYDYLSEDTA